MKIIVCDDELHARNRLMQTIVPFFNKRNITIDIYQYESAEKMLVGEKIKDADAIFLDVEMRGMNGIEAGHHISKDNPNAVLVFVSGLVKYAPSSLEIPNTIRYLVKAKLDEKIEECLNAVIKQSLLTSQTIDIDTKDGTFTVCQGDIQMVESQRHLITFHFRDKHRPVLSSRRTTMNELQTKLDKSLFLRVDKSYIVNLQCISNIIEGKNGNYCVMDDGQHVNVSFRRFKMAKQRIYAFRGIE